MSNSDVNVKISGDATKLRNEVKSLPDLFANLGKNIQSTMVGTVGHLFAVGAALEGVKKIAEGMKESLDWAHQTTLTAERLEISKEAVMAYNIAANRANLESGEWAASVEKLSKALVTAQTDPKMVETLLRLGVSLETIKNQNPEAAFEAIGRGLNATSNSAHRTADLIEVLGKKSGGLINMLKGLESAKSDAKGLTHFVSESDIALLEQYHHHMEALSAGTKTATANFTALAIQAFEFVSMAKEISQIREMFMGGADRVAEMEKQLALQKEAKQLTQDKAEQSSIENEAVAAKERLKLEQEIRKEKERISEATSKLREQNELNRMNDEERLAYLNEQLDKVSKQVDQVKQIKKTSEEWNIADTQAMHEKERLTGEVEQLKTRLYNKQVEEFKKTNKATPIKTDSETAHGNAAGKNLLDRLGNINEQMLKSLLLIEKNTRSSNTQAPNIFAT